jgi:hypothetical protein
MAERGRQLHRTFTKQHIAIAFSLVTVLLPLGAKSQNQVPLPWPKKQGVYVATSSEAIPPFPHALSGYRSEVGKDFWGKPFVSRGSVRLFEGQNWEGIPKFPNTMNGCSAGVFMVRWRSADPGIPVQSSVRYSPTTSGEARTGTFGHMSGTNCEQPMFKFTETLDRNKYPALVRGHRVSYLVDVYYELKFWQAAP